ncbi:MAG: hydrogenase maturation protease, partial [Planctomycetota bacterium]
VTTGIEVREASTPSHLLDWLAGVDRLVVCDACQARRQSEGSDSTIIHRWEWPTLQVSMLRSAGSHSFGLPQVLQLAERLGALPRDVIVFGVEGTRFDAFSELSPGVAEAVETVVETIAAELKAVATSASRGQLEDAGHA